jgi:xanthine dehydrogenase molybdenum-binding subunit
MSELSTVGKSITKIDAREKATGRAVFADDLRFPGMLSGKVVRCMTHAHAKVTNLDFSEASKVAGVVKILAPKDVTKKSYNASVIDLMAPVEVSRNVLGDIDDQNIFTDHVKHQGDAICGIIALSEEIAEKAARKINVTYEVLPVFMTAQASMQEGALQFRPEKPNNMAFQLPEGMFPENGYGWGDVDAALKEADLIVEDTFYVPRQKQCQMEPHAYVARYDDRGRLNCWTSTQMPKLVHMKLSTLFDLPLSRVKVNQTTVGGGFGVRLGMIGEPQTCALAMAVPGRHVKVSYLREEDWVASEARHSGTYWMKMGFKRDGTPVAVDAHVTYDGGGYYTHASGTAFVTGGWLIGMYRYGAIRFKGDRYYTNAAPCGAFRGYGNPQTNFVLEQLIDRACSELEIDPVEWRLQWHKRTGDDGWCLGVPYSSCALDRCLKEGAQAIGWKEKREKYANQSGVKRRGVGVSVMNHTSGAMPMLLEHTVCTVRIAADTTAKVMIACSDLGTGVHTGLQQIAAETLGFPLADIHLVVGDSDVAGFDIGAHASRTLYVGGGAILQACEDAKRQIYERAGVLLNEKPENLWMKEKKIFVKGNRSKYVDLKEITYKGVYNFFDPVAGKTIGEPGQIQGYASYFPPHNSPPFGAVFAEVEVDTETGAVKVLQIVNAYDIGRAINPLLVEGQLEGGIQQGIGYVLTEEILYNEKGLCLNSNFTDYKMIAAGDMPPCKILLIEDPDPKGPYGAKACGESGLAAPPGAIANAIYHALGFQFTEAPITKEKILQGIKVHGLKTCKIVPYGYGASYKVSCELS